MSRADFDARTGHTCSPFFYRRAFYGILFPFSHLVSAFSLLHYLCYPTRRCRSVAAPDFGGFFFLSLVSSAAVSVGLALGIRGLSTVVESVDLAQTGFLRGTRWVVIEPAVLLRRAIQQQLGVGRG